jgi:hypothetical protein
MSPETVAAIARLREQRILSDAQADAFGRVARGGLLSIRAELRLILYAGVLLLTSGVGVFLEENHDRIGPAAIAAVIGAAAAACLWYAARRSPPFTWGEAASPHVAADYVLVLSMLLFGADLAYAESQFKLLGPHWSWHLLIVSIVYLVVAYRFDSRAVLTLALTSFAAWRGVSVAASFDEAEHAIGRIRGNAIAVGILYVALGIVTARARRKAHFEPVWAGAGALLVFGGILSGVFGDSEWPAWELALVTLGAAALWVCYRLRRPFEFAIATAAIYLGGLRLLDVVVRGGSGGMFFLALWSGAALVFLIASTRRIRRSA